MSKPFIMVAPNGARRGTADHPALPITVRDITRTAVACHNAGADGLHLHIRDAEGAHSLDPAHYREAIDALTEAVPLMAIQVTTEAAGRFDVAAQLHCIETLRPAWASVSIREMARDQRRAARLYAVASEAQIRLQHILYDTQDAAQLARWQQAGVIRPGQNEAIIVLGRYDDGPASGPELIAPFVAGLQPGARWMICAFGRAEHDCLRHAAALGGDLRVGFENSLIAPDGRPWPDNAASVAALVRSLNAAPPSP